MVKEEEEVEEEKEEEERGRRRRRRRRTVTKMVSLRERILILVSTASCSEEDRGEQASKRIVSIYSIVSAYQKQIVCPFI